MPVPLPDEKALIPLRPDAAEALHIGSRETAQRLSREGRLLIDVMRMLTAPGRHR